MSRHTPHLTLRLARTGAEVAAAQALRFAVFVEEMRARGGALTNHALRLEADRFDAHCEHLLLVDTLRGDAVVGTTRLMTGEGAERAGGFASEEEFDLSALRRTGQSLLEVGRTCLHPDYRGGVARHRLWQGLASIVEQRGIGQLFGVASFPETDSERLAQALSCLQRDHLAPEAARPVSRVPVVLAPPEPLCRRTAVLGMPALVKAYLRLGGRVGEGAFLDPGFRCIDVCMVLDTAKLPERARAIYTNGRT